MKNDIKEFYDPHPGWGGAAAPLPHEVKKVADELDGQIIRIEDAIRKIRAVAQGKVEASEKHLCIFLWRGSHIWRVIRFKDPGVMGGGS